MQERYSNCANGQQPTANSQKKLKAICFQFFVYDSAMSASICAVKILRNIVSG